MYTLQFGNYTFPSVSFVVDGFPLENNIQENTVMRRDGAVVPTPYLRARNFRVTGQIYQSTQATAISDLLSMQAALMVGKKQFYYRADRYINARVKSLTPRQQHGTDAALMDVDIVFEADDPYFYSAGASISDVSNMVGVTTSFTVSNGGNVFCEPIIYICATGGTINDNIRLANTDDGTFFRFRGQVGNGLTLKFDSTQLEVRNDGVDGLSYFEGSLLLLAIGTNHFTFTGMTCRVTVEHLNRWYN